MLSGLDGTDSGPDVKASTTVMALMEASAVEHSLVSVQRQRGCQQERRLEFDACRRVV